MRKILALLILLSSVALAGGKPTPKIDTLAARSDRAPGDPIKYVASWNYTLDSASVDTLILPAPARFIEITNRGGTTDTIWVSYAQGNNRTQAFADKIFSSAGRVSRDFQTAIIRQFFIKASDTGFSVLIVAYN